MLQHMPHFLDREHDRQRPVALRPFELLHPAQIEFQHVGEKGTDLFYWARPTQSLLLAVSGQSRLLQTQVYWLANMATCVQYSVHHATTVAS